MQRASLLNSSGIRCGAPRAARVCSNPRWSPLTERNQLREKVGKTRLFERVRDAVLDDIRAGKLHPGDKLPSERDLAEHFEISRHAVREALRTLEMSGVLRFSKGVTGGAFIREGSSDGVSQSIRDMIVLGRMPLNDLMYVRINLLIMAVELAAHHATAAELAAIGRNIEHTGAMIATGDPLATIEPVLNFNTLLGKASHNLVLAMLIDSVVAIMRELLLAYKLPTEIDLVTPRRALLACLRRHDEQGAAAIIRSHYSQTTRYVLDKVRRQGHGKRKRKWFDP